MAWFGAPRAPPPPTVSGKAGSESERGADSDGSLKCLWFQTILDLTMKFKKNSASEIMHIPLEEFGKAQL